MIYWSVLKVTIALSFYRKAFFHHKISNILFQFPDIFQMVRKTCFKKIAKGKTKLYFSFHFFPPFFQLFLHSFFYEAIVVSKTYNFNQRRSINFCTSHPNFAGYLATPIISTIFKKRYGLLNVGKQFSLLKIKLLTQRWIFLSFRNYGKWFWTVLRKSLFYRHCLS